MNQIFITLLLVIVLILYTIVDQIYFGNSLQPIDDYISSSLYTQKEYTWLAISFNSVYVLIFLILIYYYCFESNRRNEVLILFTQVLIAAYISCILKICLKNPRPFMMDQNAYSPRCQQGFGNPSCHALVTMVFVLGIIKFEMNLEQGKLYKGVLYIGMIFILLYIGLTSIKIGANYLNQILFGWIFGFILWYILHINSNIFQKMYQYSYQPIYLRVSLDEISYNSQIEDRLIDLDIWHLIFYVFYGILLPIILYALIIQKNYEKYEANYGDNVRANCNDQNNLQDMFGGFDCQVLSIIWILLAFQISIKYSSPNPYPIPAVHYILSLMILVVIYALVYDFGEKIWKSTNFYLTFFVLRVPQCIFVGVTFVLVPYYYEYNYFSL